MSDNFKIDSFRGYFYYLSNFYPCNVTVNGITYQNSEAAFQAQKCIRAEDRIRFANMTPKEAKRYGKKIPLRSDWEKVKLDIMRGVLIAKFSQNPDLRNSLVSTGDAELIEGNMWGDTYWGICDNKGENHLGELLMEVRTLYKEGVL